MNRIDLKSTDSTNLYAKKIAKKTNSNTVIISEEQTTGYGTKNRFWYSDKDSIICSFLIFPKETTKIGINFSYDIGLLVSKTLNESLNINTNVKEPNDIYLNGKKVCGILVETEYLKNTLKYIIIGIGINVNQTKFPNELENIATSLFISSGKKSNKEKIINNLITVIENLMLNE